MTQPLAELPFYVVPAVTDQEVAATNTFYKQRQREKSVGIKALAPFTERSTQRTDVNSTTNDHSPTQHARVQAGIPEHVGGP